MHVYVCMYVCMYTHAVVCRIEVHASRCNSQLHLAVTCGIVKQNWPEYSQIQWCRSEDLAREVNFVNETSQGTHTGSSRYTLSCISGWPQMIHAL